MRLVSILPLATGASYTRPNARLEVKNIAKTNITEMYAFLHGSIPDGKSLVYYTQPGVEGEIFGMHTAYTSLKSGRTCIFVASSTSPCTIRDQFKEFGWDINPFKSKLFFVDAYNPLIGALSREKYVIKNPESICDLSEAVLNLLEESTPSTVVFGSLSTIMDLCGERETTEAVKLWNKMAMRHGHILVYNFTAWPYSQETLNLIKKDLFNAVICIGGVAGDIISRQYFGILKSDWMNKWGDRATKY
jgi:KaiC/GvpD/RAD55 family RecA-like ATPase